MNRYGIALTVRPITRYRARDCGLQSWPAPTSFKIPYYSSSTVLVEQLFKILIFNIFLSLGYNIASEWYMDFIH